VTRRPPHVPASDPAGGEPLPPAWGWKRPFGGRAATVTAAPEYQATTVQACGLFPFVAGTGSPLAGTPIGRNQLDGEVVCLDPLAWLRAGLVTNPGMFLLGQPGTGKALDLATPVPTPSGWTTIGRITPGDLVLDQDGRPVPVMAVSEVMAGRPCLQVSFADGTWITADEDHQWVTSLAAEPALSAAGARGAAAAPGPAAVRTTGQIRDTISAGHLIAAARPLDRPDASLIIPPYLLGAWLAGPPGTGVPPVPPGGHAGDWADYRGAAGAGVLRAQLGILGLLGARAVPSAYLRGSAAQRRALLAGLLDAAGTVPRPGLACWAAPARHLARGAAELARTLGHTATLRPGPAGGWEVTIRAAGPLFRHPARRAACGTPSKLMPAFHHVTSVTPVPSRPVRCIQVASAAGLFLAGDAMVPTHNSTLVKRLAVGAAARGDTVLVLGDPRPDYAMLAEHLGGQVIRVGRGMDRINPLDAGPLGSILPQLPPAEAARVRAEARARRLSLLMGLCTLVRGQPLGNDEEVILGAAIDLLDARHRGTPVIPDVLRVIDEGPDALRAAARAEDPQKYQQRAASLTFTLDLLLTGTLAGAFDGPTTTPIDIDAPMVTVDLSRVTAAGDKLLTAAMLCTWSYGFGTADAYGLLAESGIPARHSSMVVLDELWRALRGAPGLVEYADALTRLNRAKGMASIMITHSLADLDALPTEEDRAKARGFIERSAITVYAALPPRELARVSQITPLTGPEQDLVASWSAPDSWQPGARHPGRGKYLVKTGGRLGIPVEMSLVQPEIALYDTDQAIRPAASFARSEAPGARRIDIADGAR
jgi:hypothetical protein